MPVALSNIRDLLLPGLKAHAYECSKLKEQRAAEIFCDQLTTKPAEMSVSFTLDEIQQAEQIIAAARAGSRY